MILESLLLLDDTKIIPTIIIKAVNSKPVVIFSNKTRLLRIIVKIILEERIGVVLFDPIFWIPSYNKDLPPTKWNIPAIPIITKSKIEREVNVKISPVINKIGINNNNPIDNEVITPVYVLEVSRLRLCITVWKPKKIAEQRAKINPSILN